MDTPSGAALGRAAVACAVVAAIVSACDAGPVVTPPVRPGTSGSPRDLNVIARDYEFLPVPIDLVAGETVVLHLVNGGLETHEAIFGNASVQAAWEVAEAATIGAPPGPTPAVSVPPGVAGLRVVVGSGERVDVTWTVPEDAADAPGFVVGCHIPGHFARGMVVPVRWVGSDGRPIDVGGDGA